MYCPTPQQIALTMSSFMELGSIEIIIDWSSINTLSGTALCPVPTEMLTITITRASALQTLLVIEKHFEFRIKLSFVWPVLLELRDFPNITSTTILSLTCTTNVSTMPTSLDSIGLNTYSNYP